MVLVSPKLIGGCFGGRKSVGKPGSRWQDTGGRDALELLQIRNWKAAARKTEGWRKGIRKAIPITGPSAIEEDEEEEEEARLSF
jgi:hypothetical protein